MNPLESNEKMTLLRLYDYEYEIIPQLIELSIKNTETWEEFIRYQSNIDWILNTVLAKSHIQCDFDVSCLRSDVIAEENFAVIIYTFPEPLDSPFAKYGAIVLNHESVSYYTLEKSVFQAEEGWVLGTASTKMHSNYGRVDDCHSLEEFFKLLKNRGFVDGNKCIEKTQKSIFKRLIDKIRCFWTKLSSDDIDTF